MAFQRLIAKITDLLPAKDFRKLRRACYQEIQAPDSTIPESLMESLHPTESLDDMLDVLAKSSYWNCHDLRLLQAIVIASGSEDAEKLLNDFKAKFNTEK